MRVWLHPYLHSWSKRLCPQGKELGGRETKLEFWSSTPDSGFTSRWCFPLWETVWDEETEENGFSLSVVRIHWIFVFKSSGCLCLLTQMAAALDPKHTTAPMMASNLFTGAPKQPKEGVEKPSTVLLIRPVALLVCTPLDALHAVFL